MKTSIPRFVVISLILTSAFTDRLFCQPETRWMSVGSFQNWYSNAGCEIELGRAFNEGDEQDGFQWPAISSYQDMQAAKGQWIGTTNYQDDVTFYPIQSHHNHSLWATQQGTRNSDSL